MIVVGVGLVGRVVVAPATMETLKISLGRDEAVDSTEKEDAGEAD